MDREQLLDEIVTAYLKALEAGQQPDTVDLLARHPDLAEELNEFFAAQNSMDQAAARLRGLELRSPAAGDARTLASPSSPKTPAQVSADAPVNSGSNMVRYFGDYELLDEIARGGMGVVYKARQVTLNRLVALKMILTGQLASAEEVQRFRTEAEAAAGLDHPFIVPIYEVGEHEGQQYFSMKLIQGESLAQRLARGSWNDGTKESQRAGASLIAAAAHAIHHAHQRGILHRDLKPGNILLQPVESTKKENTSNAKAASDQAADASPTDSMLLAANSSSIKSYVPQVTDFGLAKRFEGAPHQTRTGAIVGTPSYMPPEQARSEKPLTTGVDIYSLGAILYELLTGRPPFRGGTPLETIMQVLDEEPERPRALCPAVDADLETIVLKCLEKDARRRYDSAASLAADLEHWLAGEPIAARPTSFPERCGKWAMRRPALASLLVVCVLAPLVLLAVLARSNALIHGEQQKTEHSFHSLAAEEAATRQALERLQRLSYAQNTALAKSEWEASNIENALRALDACPSESRHWEWFYLKRLCHGEQRTLECAAPHIRALAYRPDGKVLAGAGGMVGYGPFVGSQEVVLWDADSGRPMPPFRNADPLGAVTGAAWSLDGARLALALWCLDDARDIWGAEDKASEDTSGRIEIWDVAKGKLIHSLRGHHSFVNGVAISSDGKRIASASSDRTAQVWDAETGRLLHRLSGHRGQVMAVTFSPANDLLATGGQGPLNGVDSRRPDDVGEVLLWDEATGRLKKRLAGHDLGVLCVAFSPTGSTLVSGGIDQSVKIWDSSSGVLLRTLYGHSDSVTAATFSSDGKILATASTDRTIRLWNWQDGKPLATLRGHLLPVQAIAFHPDGKHLASCGGDHRNPVEIKTWDITTKEDISLGSPQAATAVKQIRLNFDGSRAAVMMSSDGFNPAAWRMFDTASPEAALPFPAELGAPDALQFSPDGSRITTLQGTDQVKVQSFDVKSGRLLNSFLVRQYEEPKPPDWNRFQVSAALDQSGSRLATGDAARHEIVVWNCADGKEVRRLPHALGDAVTLVFSPDGRRLAIIADERFPEEKIQWKTTRVTVWEPDTGRILVDAGPTRVRFHGWHSRFSEDGVELALLGDEGTLRVWNIEQDTFRDLDVGRDCSGARFSPDGKTLATVHSGDKRIVVRLWNLLTGAERFALNELGEGQSSSEGGDDLVFSADGRRLFTTGDGTLKIWDLSQGNLLLSLRSAFSPVCLSADQTTVATAGPQGTARIWRSTKKSGNAASDR